MEKKTQLVFIIQAYERHSDDGMKLLEAVEIEIFAASAEAAIERAKTLVKKNNYRVTRIIEIELKGK